MDPNIKKVWTHLEVVVRFLCEGVCEEDLKPADAVFVFGHFEPRVAEHAARVWRRGVARKVIISGKGRDQIPVGYSAEADFYADIARFQGVSNHAFILEKDATNTLENVRYGMRVALNEGFQPMSLILVAVPVLLRRACATFRKQFPDVEVCGSPFVLPEHYYTEPRILRWLEEFDRLEKYAKCGDIMPVEVPQHVLLAAEQIRSAFVR